MTGTTRADEPARPGDTGPGDTVVTAELLVSPAGVTGPGWVRWRDGVIREVGRGAAPVAVTARGAVLAPGLVDVHCHGGGGASFTTGSPDDARRVAAAHLRHGTTRLVASLVTAPVAELADHLRALVPLVHDGTLAGLHLEGPWLSPAHPGAHDPRHLQPPRPADVDRLVEAGAGALRMVTLAPELPGASDTVRALTEAGVTVAIGHTAAGGDEVRAAVAAGARVVTHLCNAMPPLHHRAPGPVPAMLEDPRLAVELIADGVHLHPEVLALMIRAARGTPILVSDAMAAAGSGDGGYLLGSVPVEVRDGVARTEAGSIAGSTLTLDRAVRTAVAAGSDPVDAVRAASSAPAAALGLAAGRLETGASADLVLFDEGLHVRQVWRDGTPVHPPS